MCTRDTTRIQLATQAGICWKTIQLQKDEYSAFQEGSSTSPSWKARGKISPMDSGYGIRDQDNCNRSASGCKSNGGEGVAEKWYENKPITFCFMKNYESCYRYLLVILSIYITSSVFEALHIHDLVIITASL